MNCAVEDIVRRPDGVSRKAQEECGRWLAECLRLGWGRGFLNQLENIWWQHHDKRGDLKTPNDKAHFSEVSDSDRRIK